MNEREGRKRLILRIDKRNDCFGRVREIECVIWKRRMRSWGVIRMRVRAWMVVDLYDRYEFWRCVFVCSSTMRERGIFGGIGG